MRTMNCHRRKFFFIPLIAIGFLLFGYVTMLLWNVLLPAIFNVSTITFWQAIGLLILARLLFGGFRPHRHSGWNTYRKDKVLHSKIHDMSPEERREFFRKMHYDRSVWHKGHTKENGGDHDHSNEVQNKE